MPLDLSRWTKMPSQQPQTVPITIRVPTHPRNEPEAIGQLLLVGAVAFLAVGAIVHALRQLDQQGTPTQSAQLTTGPVWTAPRLPV